MVQNVEEVTPELEPWLLAQVQRNPEVLHQPEIEIPEARTPQNIAPIGSGLANALVSNPIAICCM